MEILIHMAIATTIMAITMLVAWRLERNGIPLTIAAVLACGAMAVGLLSLILIVLYKIAGIV